MKRNLYLSTNGRLHRKESTIYYFTKEGRRILPIDQVKALFLTGHVSLTSGVVSFLARMGIPVHFFGHYGHYEGSLFPRRKLVSGFAILRQAKAVLDPDSRHRVASALVRACINNMAAVLYQYRQKAPEIAVVIQELERNAESIIGTEDIPVLMSIEGGAWASYYRAFDCVITDFRMGARVKRPPNNPVNALISFGNSVLYGTVLTQLYHTQLDPAISFLHEAHERRFSLALDMAEVFKPEFVDKVIFNSLNLGKIREEHFDRELNYCVLTEEGRKLYLTELENTLRESRKHPKLKRNVTNEYMIRLDCYKLMKHVVEGSHFAPYLTSRGM